MPIKQPTSASLAPVAVLLTVIAAHGCAVDPVILATFSITLDQSPLVMEPVKHGLDSGDGGDDSPSGGSGDKSGRKGSGSSGTGGGAAPAAPPIAVTVATSQLFSVFRVAGQDLGGLDLGDDSLAATFRRISGVVSEPDGTLYACDPVTHHIRRIPSEGPTSVVAGTGDGLAGYFGDNQPANGTRLNTPIGLARSDSNGVLFVCDSNNNRVRYFLPGGRIYTLAGGGTDPGEVVSMATNALVQQPWGVAVDATGGVYFSERGSGRIRRVDSSSRLSTLATLNPGEVGALAVSRSGDRLWVAEGGRLRLIRPLDTAPLRAAPILELPGAVVTGLAFDQVDTLYFSHTQAASSGREGTRVESLLVDSTGAVAAGQGQQPLAGTAESSDASSDYSVPTTPLADAREQLLAGAGHCALYVDLHQADDPDVLAGWLLIGNSYQDTASGVRWGQIARLSPSL